MEELTSTCPICGHIMLGAHCKLICRNCGYREDCTDLFPLEQRCQENASGTGEYTAHVTPPEDGPPDA